MFYNNSQIENTKKALYTSSDTLTVNFLNGIIQFARIIFIIL